MSQENVELVRQSLDSVNRGDIDGALELAADDVEMDWSNSIGPAKGIYRGREQVRGFWASFLEAFDALRWDPEEIIEVDESRLIVMNRIRMRGRGSGGRGGRGRRSALDDPRRHGAELQALPIES